MEENMGKSRDVKKPDAETITNIIDNYSQNEKALVNQLYFKATHGTTIGGFREDIWKGMFQQMIPKKFTIEQSVFIIDSEGRVSNEVDLAIFDETYTPYIFRYGKLKFIPIEAVAVAVECKSQSMDISNIKNWAESIVALKTSSESYTRMATSIIVGEEKSVKTQTQTRPLRILCCLNETIKDGRFENGEKLFDMIVRASSKEMCLKIEIDEEKESLQDWYLALNHAGGQFEKKEDGTIKEKINEKDEMDINGNKIKAGSKIGTVKLIDYQVEHKDTQVEQKDTPVEQKDTPVSLLSFNLQLNQILMLINNPILFPHKAYVNMFNKFGKEGKSNE